MQINPFGFPLGAGTQAPSTMGGTGLGFADALGFAVDANTPVITGLTGSTTMPAHFDAKVAQIVLANAQRDGQPVPATPPLPGLQQPTSLSQLMATAAKLPAAEPAPLAGQAPVAQPAVAQPEIPQPLAAEPAAVQPDVAQPAPAEAAPAEAAPAEPELPATKPVVAAPVQAPAKTPVETAAVALPVEAEAQPEAPAVEAPSAKPQKRVRTVAAEAEPIQLEAPAPASAPAAVVPQPVAVQPQPVARDAATPQAPGTAPAKKAATAPAAAVEATAPGTTGAGTTDFANAVTAQGGKQGAEANADGQPQPEFVPGTLGKADTPAPVAAHAAHHSASVDAARAAAPAAPAPAPHAEPVIDAHRHLGQSLGVEIAKKVELGEEMLRIRLNPIELGRIEVTLAFDDKGALQATVRADSAQAMDLLRQDAGDLARTLDQAGVRTDAQSFRFEQRSGNDGTGQQAQHQHAQNRGQFASSEDDALAAEPIYRPVRSDGQVDLLA